MAKWYDDTGFQGDIVLSTRVRLARNLKGIPFPNKMSDDDAKKVVELVSGALENMNYGFTRLDLNAMSKTEKQKLVEKRYISPDLAKQTKPCAVFISDDESVSIMVNEEEHIKLTGKTGKNIREMFAYLDEIQKPIWIRHVLVPGITDNDEYLTQTRDFIRTLSNVYRVEILPYHNLAISKYRDMGIKYALENTQMPSAERIENARKILECDKYTRWQE